MKKKLLLILTVLTLVSSALLLSGCGNSEEESDGSYTITYYYLNSATPVTVEVTDSESFTLSPPSRIGYTFQGLYDSETAGTQIVNGQGKLNITLNRDMTLYAQWEAKDYHVFLDTAGGELVGSEKNKTYGYDSDLVALPLAVKEGYNFLGWAMGDVLYTDASGLVSVDKQKFNNENYVFGDGDVAILTAMWERRMMTVTYNYNDVTYTTKTVELYYGGTLPLSELLFIDTGAKETLGWSYSTSSGVLINADITNITEDITLYAVWRSYKVVQFVESDSAVSEKKIYSDVLNELYVPERGGYAFEGWYTSPSYGGNPVTAVQYFNAADKYYAKWNTVDYTASFEAEGEVTGDTSPKGYNIESGLLLPTLTKDKFTFLGWCRNEDLSDEPIMLVEVGNYGNVTFYAKFKGEDRSVTLDAAEGTLTESEFTLEYGAINTLPIPECNSEYAFSGWYLSDGTRLTDERGVTLEKYFFDTTEALTARYSPKYHVTVEIAYPAGELEIADYYIEGQKVSLSFRHSDTGYSYGGFYKGDTLVSAGYSYEFDMPGENVSLRVELTPKTYTLSLNADGGYCIDTYEVTYGAPFALPIAYKDGYSFDGWSLDGVTVTDKTGASSAAWSYGYDAVLKAVYTEAADKTYTVITDLATLKSAIENNVTNGIIVNNIDLGGAVWTPAVFKGVIDGCGFTLSNFSIAGNASDIGFFSELRGTVKNLGFVDVRINSTGTGSAVGIIAARNYGTVKSCYAYGVVNAPYASYVGGLVGRTGQNSYIISSVNYAGVTGATQVGGLVGYADSKSTIESSTNKGAVNGSGTQVGGIAGYQNGTATLLENYGKVVGGADKVGGVFGQSEGTVTGCNAYGEVSGKTDYVGGIIGQSTGKVTDSYSSGAVSGRYYVGGAFGYVKGAVSDYNNRAAVTGTAYVGGVAGKAAASFTGCTNNGIITTVGVYTSSGTDYSYVGGIVGYNDKAYEITNCASYVNISVEGYVVGGIAGYGGTVNDSVNTGNVTSRQGRAGGIIGESYGTLRANVNRGNVKGTYAVGGIVGIGDSVSLNSSENMGEVVGENSVGGIAGRLGNPKPISGNKNNGSVTGNTYVGGYVGYVSGSGAINGAESSVAVTADAYVGGILGYGTQTTLTDCKNTGTVTISDPYISDGKIYSYIGGLAGVCSAITNGYNGTDISGIGGFYTGGLAAYCYGNISDSVNEGAVVGSDYTGGLVGYMESSSVSGSKNKASVTGALYTGGIAGYAKKALTVLSSENLADVVGDNNTGGYFGYLAETSTVRGAKNENTVKGRAYLGGIVGCGSYTSLISCENSGEIISVGAITSGSDILSYIGGLAGYVSELNDCKNTSDISGDGAYVGGLAGRSRSAIVKSHNTGAVVGNKYTGGLIGECAGIVTDSTNTGTVTGSGICTGGIIGYYTSSKIEGCTNSGAVSGVENTGGIVGKSTATFSITSTENTASVTGTNYTGGYIGYAGGTTTIYKLTNTSTVTGHAYVGGILGYGASTTLDSCENEGEVNAIATVTSSNVACSFLGGIAGYANTVRHCKNSIDLSGIGAYVGGVAGYAVGASDSSNNGAVTGANYTGGVIGYCGNGGISYCTCSGAITGVNYVGGIVGYTNSSKVEWSENTAQVSGTEYVGGLLGYAYSTIEISYSKNSGDVSGTNYVGSLLGYARQQVTLRSNENLGKATDTYAQMVGKCNSTAYGVPKIGAPSVTDVKVSDTVTAALIGMTATDYSAAKTFDITVELSEGAHEAGETPIYAAYITDDYGNKDVRYFSVRVYGAPTLGYSAPTVSFATNPMYKGSLITFDMNGVSADAPAPQLITDEVSLVYPAIPVVKDYVFRGWFTEPECVNIFDFTSSQSGDRTLYAGWHKIETVGIANDVVEVYNNYNDTSNLYTAFKDDRGTSANPRYVYFTARTSGEYTIYYRNSSNISCAGNYTSYIQVTNVTDGTEILANTSIETSKNATVTVSLDAGDVICVRMYAKYAGYSVSCQFFVVGGGFPSDGGLDEVYEKPRDILGVTASDTFGGDVTVEVALKEGSFEVGSYVVYTVTATDKLGNTTTVDTEPILVT